MDVIEYTNGKKEIKIFKVKKLSKNIINKLKKSLKVNKANLHSPIFNKDEINELTKCISSTFVSTSGNYINLFEKKISKITGAKYVISIVNGTSALDLCIKALNIKKNTEILVPSLTFIAPVNSIIYNNCNPHFVDVNSDTLGVDYKKLETYLRENCYFKNNKLINKKTKRSISAIIPVHLFGHPVRIDKILNIAKKYNLFLIEDAAEALGSYFKNKHLGTFGNLGVISFNGNKIITTGGGGVILSNNKNLANKIKHLSTTAKKPHLWNYIHDEVGYNYRMPNINAALGCAQLKKLKKILILKRKLFYNYKNSFLDDEYVDVFKEPKESKSNYWFQTLILKNKYRLHKENLLKDLNESKYQSRPAWSLVHKLKKYNKFPKMDLKNCENLYSRIINIPSNNFKYIN